MKFICVRRMSPVFNLLKIFVSLYLCVKQPVFINIFLILDLLAVRKLLHDLFMLLLQLSNLFVVITFYLRLFQLTACLHFLVVFRIEMLIQIAFGILDQL